MIDQEEKRGEKVIITLKAHGSWVFKSEVRALLDIPN